ncbi:alpha/beta fold hydrolase [Variovorax sp. PBS-H4]|uniref:alpha/beta fold hydrolase n=1 Tax=Variovorax sp. PBS-H4 TaxID=434008 RepID=UPI0013A5912B|nr:alpha/beta fold hydrolase [Variovorax sp. PBS-H4]
MTPARKLPIGAETIAVREAGSAGRPCIVLLHSLGTSAAMWAPQLAALSASYHVVAIDSRGHGGSSNRGGFSVEGCAEDAVGVIGTLGCKTVHLVGLSMGGLIATEVASRLKRDASVRCASLALACAYRTLRGAQSEARLASARDALSRQGMPEFAAAYMKDTATDGMPAPMRERLQRDIAGMKPGDYLQTLECILFHDAGPALSELGDMPALVISGALDKRVSKEALQELLDAVPHARRVCLMSAGHLASAEDDIDFNAALLGFWESCAPDAAEGAGSAKA